MFQLYLEHYDRLQLSGLLQHLHSFLFWPQGIFFDLSKTIYTCHELKASYFGSISHSSCKNNEVTSPGKIVNAKGFFFFDNVCDDDSFKFLIIFGYILFRKGNMGICS
jgi:hypothetical protein